MHRSTPGGAIRTRYPAVHLPGTALALISWLIASSSRA